MLYETALDPAVLRKACKSRAEYRDFIRCFEFGEPYVLSGFPSQKFMRRAAKGEMFSCTNDDEAARATELLAFLGDAPSVKRSVTYDGQVDWAINIVRENARCRFDYVLTDGNIDIPNRTELDSLLYGEARRDKQKAVPRSADAMAMVFGNIFRLASHIVYVDTYFNHRLSFWDPFIRFCECAMRDRPGPIRSFDVVYWGDAQRAASAKYLYDKLAEQRPDILESLRVRFRAIREKAGGQKLHNRYILTDIGGVHVGTGLDEESNQQTDDAVLLDSKLYALRWEQYARLSAFELVQEFGG